MNLHMHKVRPECEVAGLKTARNRLDLNLRKFVTSFCAARINTDSGIEIETDARLLRTPEIAGAYIYFCCGTLAVPG
jgi:hypothetical protein